MVDTVAYLGGAKLKARFPTIAHLRQHARRHIPHFAFEYCDGGAGTDTGIAHNWAALDAVELVPRYGVMPSLPPVDVELFGRKYAAPIGVPPMGGPALVWPGADRFLARAAQQARVPYVLGTVGGITIEEAAALAPDMFWFQLYRLPRNDHALGFDLVRRADAAGAHVLVLTLDVPVRTTRPREVVVGLGGAKFSPDLRMIVDMLRSPGWLMALQKHGHPRFANLKPYAGENAEPQRRDQFRARARWAARSPGTRSPASAIAGSGRWCSRASCIRSMPNARCRSASTASGYRTTAAARSRRCRRPIDVLPAIAAQVGSRATVLFDCGVRSGTDVVRALALGRAGGLCRQGVPLGPRRARRRRPPARDRPSDRRDACGARSDRCALAGRSALGRDPPSRSAWRSSDDATLTCAGEVAIPARYGLEG